MIFPLRIAYIYAYVYVSAFLFPSVIHSPNLYLSHVPATICYALSCFVLYCHIFCLLTNDDVCINGDISIALTLRLKKAIIVLDC